MKNAVKPKAPRTAKTAFRTVIATPAAKAAEAPKRPDRRLLLSGGIILAVAALFLLANSGFFLKRVEHRLNPPVVREPSPPEAADPYLLELAGTPDRIRIPSLGIDAPIVEAATRTQAAYKTALQQGVVHFPGTPEAGEVGNAYFFGHSSDFPWAKGGYKTVFAVLPDIELGATIYVTDHDGNAFAYAADGTRVVVPSDLSVLADPGNGKRMLTLQTSYPVGTALRRFIVTASYAAEVLVR
ncbi:MAG TPA: sortase [Candidatus Baltobacteraceae bacterium]|nr:sortase [Candidatus Baltobacteraceae bacterium]